MKKVAACEIIKQLRLERGLSQKELADKIGLTQQAIALLENNKRKLEFDLFLEILEKLDTTNEELSDIINSIFCRKNEILANIGSISITVNFATDEETALFLEVIEKLGKMNADGMKEAGRYINYLLSDNRYIDSGTPPQD